MIRKITAFILSWIAELVAVGCKVHDFIIVPISTKFPSTRKFLRKKVFNIKGSTDDDKDTIYLQRYVVFQTKKLRLYIHRFLRSDYPVHHDHPWTGKFLHLRNTYTEEVLRLNTRSFRKEEHDLVHATGRGIFRVITTKRKLLDVTCIDRQHIHRVRLDKEYHLEPWKAPLTLALCGDRRKTANNEDDWGFWVTVSSHKDMAQRDILIKERVHWKEHLQVTNDNLSKKASH
jgi:hypothetical protein